MKFIISFSIAWVVGSMALSCQSDQPDSSLPEPLAEMNLAIQSGPENTDLYKTRAAWYLENGDFEKAIADWEKVLQLDSNQLEHFHLLAQGFQQDDQGKKAIRTLQRAQKYFPDSLSTGLKLAYYQYLNDQNAAALFTLEELQKKHPKNADILYLKAINQLEQGDTALSIKELEKGALIDPSIQAGEMLLLLAELYSRSGNGKALALYDQVIALYPERWDAYLGKGDYFASEGVMDKALQAYRTLILRNPQFSEAYLRSGLIYLQMDSLAQAARQISLAIQTDPVSVDAYYWSGVVSEAQGKVTLAIQQYQQVLQLNPASNRASQALERLSSDQ